jgi:peptide/nickel transport system substrate-binding protein
MLRCAFVWLIIGLAVTLAGIDATAASKPEGQLVIAFDTSIAPTYLDPAETPGTATPFTFLYALHDALIKPSLWGTRGRRLAARRTPCQ